MKINKKYGVRVPEEEAKVGGGFDARGVVEGL